MAAEAIVKFGGYLPDARQSGTNDTGPVNITVQSATFVLQVLSDLTYENDSSEKQGDSNVIEGVAHDDNSVQGS